MAKGALRTDCGSLYLENLIPKPALILTYV